MSGGAVKDRYDSILKVCPCPPLPRPHSHCDLCSIQGFSAQIPDTYLPQLQSFVGDVIDYIGKHNRRYHRRTTLTTPRQNPTVS